MQPGWMSGKPKSAHNVVLDVSNAQGIPARYFQQSRSIIAVRTVGGRQSGGAWDAKSFNLANSKENDAIEVQKNAIKGSPSRRFHILPSGERKTLQLHPTQKNRRAVTKRP
jgi:hypothetical protein